MKHPRHPPRAGRQRGLTLVELMVAMAIGLIVIAGLALLFANSSRASRELESTSRHIENGRYAAELLAQELMAAGYYGDVPATGAVYTAPDACATALAQLGWDGGTSSRPYALEGKTAAELAALACASNPAPGVAALVLRRLATEPTAAATINNAEGHVYVQTSQCNADAANIPFVYSNDKAALTLRNLACTGAGEVRRYLSRLYYVASCNECAGAGADTLPTLKRAELSGGAIVVTPLAAGIERLALEYGFDTDADGIPDTYRTGLSGTAGAADNDWANVVTARVYVLARSAEPTPGYTDSKTYALGLAGNFGPYNDSIKRKVFVTTAKLQNVAGPREK